MNETTDCGLNVKRVNSRCGMQFNCVKCEENENLERFNRLMSIYLYVLVFLCDDRKQNPQNHSDHIYS